MEPLKTEPPGFGAVARAVGRRHGEVGGRWLAGLLVLTFVVFAWTLTVGDFPVSVRDVLATLVGQGSGQSEFVVRRLRLPRALTAVLVGAAFGMSGAIFQRLARNPLASPDVIGVNAGAAVTAVFFIVVLDAGSTAVTIGALIGALVTSLVIYLLAYRRGVSGYRLVLVGIAISLVLTSATHYLLTRAQIFDAARALAWITGSLNGRGWSDVRHVGIALVILVPLALILGRQLRVLELGDDVARGLGVRVEPVRAAVLLVGVAMAAVGTAAAGPIGFAALVSPQIARRLVGGGSPALLPSAAVGALLLVGADLVGRRIVAPTELPVGVITAIVGAPYLLLLLARANRLGSGG